MITEAQRNIVRTTVPVLKEHGEAITSEFYRQLFTDHPELLNIFNQANQRRGGQSASLAASILMYAAHIYHVDKLGGMVDYIAHKHGSLEVQPEHYPIVGDYLLRAIRTVLSAAATDEIIDAWAAAYGDLAAIFIQREQQLYEENSSQHGGWNGYKPFTVIKKFKESETVMSVYLSPEDGQPLPPFAEGQFLSLKLMIPGNTNQQIRQYNISCASNGAYYRISVGHEKTKTAENKVIEGVVSTYIHEELRVGSTIAVHMPLGAFALNQASTRPAVLLSGGTGITPVLSMLHRLDQLSDRDTYFFHGVRNRALHAFRKEARSIAQRNKKIRALFFYSEVSKEDVRGEHYDEHGFIDAEKLVRHLPSKDADFYYCGPLPFLRSIDAMLDHLGISPTRRFSEAFAPDPSLIVAKAV